MKKIYYLTRKELGTYFSSTTAYIILTFYLLLTGAFFYSNLNAYAESRVPGHYEDTMSVMVFITVLITPLVTMKLIAEERSKGTLDSLFSTPVTEAQIIIAKFLSSMLFYLFLLLPTLIHIYILAMYAIVDYHTIMCGYVGIIMLASALFSLGLLISSLCSNQITAGIITLVLSLILIFSDAGAVNLERGSILKIILLRISFIRNSEPFIKGIIDTRSLLYFVSIVIVCIYISSKSLSIRLWSRGRLFKLGIFLILLFYNGILLNFISLNSYIRADFTRDKKFELSEKSKQIVRNLEAKVKIYAVPPVSDNSFLDQAAINAWNHFREFMLELEKQSQMIIYKEPRSFDLQEIEEIREVFGEALQTSKIYVIIGNKEQGRKHKTINFPEIYRGDPNTGKIAKFYAESKIVNSIKDLLYTAKKYIYFTTGHKEHPTDPKLGLGVLFQYLMVQDNIEWRQINLQSIKSMPKDCALLCIFGATEDLKDEEISLLKDYISNGGRLLVTLMPNDYRAPLINHDTFIAKHGIKIDRAPILNINQRGFIAVAEKFPDHEINTGMVNLQLYFPNSCFLEENLKASRDYKWRPILISDKFSEPVYQKYIKATDSYQEVRGSMGSRFLGMISVPVVLDEESFPADKRFRIAVLSSTTAFAANALRFYAIQGGTNPILQYFENVYKWLTEREGEIFAPPKSFEEKPIVLPVDEQKMVFFVAVVFMPLFGIISGLITYFRRRK